MTPYLIFTGWSGSGKTTLLEQVVSILSHRGLSVAVIKHGHHEPSETPGKDTARYREAGAEQVVYAGPSTVTLWSNRGASGLHEALELVSGADLAIVEGFKAEPGPKVEVRRGPAAEPIATPETGLVAVASDEPPVAGFAGDVEWLDINAPEQVADFVERYLALGGGRRERSDR